MFTSEAIRWEPVGPIGARIRPANTESGSYDESPNRNAICKSVVMVDNFQASSSAQGRAFEEAVQTIVRMGGHDIVNTGFTDGASGEQVDLLVRTSSGIDVWIECKGSWNTRSNVPGLRRSDTAKKAVANAWHLRNSHGDDRPPYILVTSHLPREGSYSDRLLKDAKEAGLFTDVVEYTEVNNVLNGIT
jgi:hypothetical protein